MAIIVLAGGGLIVTTTDVAVLVGGTVLLSRAVQSVQFQRSVDEATLAAADLVSGCFEQVADHLAGILSARLRPDPGAVGPHTTFRRDPRTGKVTDYEEWRHQTNPHNPNPWESVKRYHSEGKSHYNKQTGEYEPTPHVHDPGVPGGVRPAIPEEIPQ